MRVWIPGWIRKPERMKSILAADVKKGDYILDPVVKVWCKVIAVTTREGKVYTVEVSDDPDIGTYTSDYWSHETVTIK